MADRVKLVEKIVVETIQVSRKGCQLSAMGAERLGVAYLFASIASRLRQIYSKAASLNSVTKIGATELRR